MGAEYNPFRNPLTPLTTKFIRKSECNFQTKSVVAMQECTTCGFRLNFMWPCTYNV